MGEVQLKSWGQPAVLLFLKETAFSAEKQELCDPFPCCEMRAKSLRLMMSLRQVVCCLSPFLLTCRVQQPAQHEALLGAALALHGSFASVGASSLHVAPPAKAPWGAGAALTDTHECLQSKQEDSSGRDRYLEAIIWLLLWEVNVLHRSFSLVRLWFACVVESVIRLTFQTWHLCSATPCGIWSWARDPAYHLHPDGAHRWAWGQHSRPTSALDGEKQGWDL